MNKASEGGGGPESQNFYHLQPPPAGYQNINGKLVKITEGNKGASYKTQASPSNANTSGDSAVSQPQSDTESTVNNNYSEGLQGATLGENKSTQAQEQNLSTLGQHFQVIHL